MACGCENTREIFPNCDMSRWEVQCSSYIEDADNYYTKPQIDEMLEEIESAITSGCCITPEEVDEKIDEAVSGKQDTLSAGTNIIISGNVISASGCDLTDYYTKEQVDERIPHYSAGTGIDITDNVISCTVTGSSGCGCDLSDYVTFDDMAEYVGDVYTKTEVNNLFVTKATFNTYITNLQQQIDSLKEAISGCCGSTGETEYRWIVVPNDYTCSGTTKMTKDKQQSSTDGINWTDTGQYRTGSTVLEYNSTDCGYAPSSNFKVRANYKRGYTVGSGQVECNSSTTVTNDELKAQITFPTYFTSLEFGSCIDTIGEDAFINGGNVSQVIIPSNIKTLDTCAFSNCGFANYQINEGLTTIGKTAFVNNYNLSAITLPSSVTSIGIQAFFNCTNLTTVAVLATTPPAISYTQGWNSSIFDGCGNLATIYVPAASLEAYKAADGWILYADKIQAIQTPTKFIAYYNQYSANPIYSAECDSNTALTTATTRPSGYETYNMLSAEAGDCITSIGEMAFNQCYNITAITIGSGVTAIGNFAFGGCTELQGGITIKAIVPPSLGFLPFDNTNNCPIYVPSGSVNAYKSAWTDVSSRIQAIPNS